MVDMVFDGKGCVCMDFIVFFCGFIGFCFEFLIMMFGIGIMNFMFFYYGELKEGDVSKCQNGVLIFMIIGKMLGYVLFNLQDWGCFMIDFNVEVYEGQVIGIYLCGNDLVINLIKVKQLINIWVVGIDENIVFILLICYLLEQVLDFIDKDELVEVIFSFICICKKLLKENECKCVFK